MSSIRSRITRIQKSENWNTQLSLAIVKSNFILCIRIRIKFNHTRTNRIGIQARVKRLLAQSLKLDSLLLYKSISITGSGQMISFIRLTWMILLVSGFHTISESKSFKMGCQGNDFWKYFGSYKREVVKVGKTVPCLS